MLFKFFTIVGINRPTTIHLANNNLTYLNQSIFEPFFDEDQTNLMNFDNNLFICDCRMKWLVDKNIKTKKQIEKSISGLICPNKESIWQLSNQHFNNC